MRTIVTLVMVVIPLPMLAADVIRGVVVPEHQVIVSTPLEGVVEDVRVLRGDHVKKGQVLARMDAMEPRLQLERAMAEYRIAEAQHQLARLSVSDTKILDAELAEAAAIVQLAEREFARAKQLQQPEAISEVELSKREQAFLTAKARVEQLELKRIDDRSQRTGSVAAIEAELMLVKAEIKAAQQRVDRCIVRSPIDGTILRHNLQSGSYMRRGDLSITVADLERMVVTALVPEEKLPLLRKGLKCRIKTVLGELDAVVRDIAPVVENGMIDCVFALEEREIDLLPGMTANIVLEMSDIDGGR